MRDWIRARCIIYLEEKEKKKKKEMETLVLVIATVQEYPIRDTRNRSKRKSQQCQEKREKKREHRHTSYANVSKAGIWTRSSLPRGSPCRCHFRFSGAFSVRVLLIESSLITLHASVPYRNIYHTMISITRDFQNRFEILNSRLGRGIAARSIAAAEIAAKLPNFRAPCTVFRAHSFRFTDLIVFHHFHSKWKVNGTPPFRRSSKIKSSNDESQRGERRDSHRLTRDLFPPLVSADLCHNRQELAKARC